MLRIDAGQEEARTAAIVIAEIFYVLSGRTYRAGRAEIAASLRPILSMRGLLINGKSDVMRALEIAEAFPELDFEDCLIAAEMMEDGIAELYSFDRGFEGVPGVIRLEPAAP